MFCRFCGKELGEDFKICPFCAKPVAGTTNPGATHTRNAGDFGGLKTLGFFLGLFGSYAWFLPVVSLVLYILWRNERPNAAAALGKYTIFGLIAGVSLAAVLFIVLAVIFICFASGSLLGFVSELSGELYDVFLR